MTKRRGLSERTKSHQKTLLQAGTHKTILTIAELLKGWGKIIKMMHSYISVVYSAVSGSYGIIITILVVLFLSFLLPDISQKAQATQELKNMRTVLDKISTEVKKAEVACLTVADDIHCLHCTMHEDAKKCSKAVEELSLCTSHQVRTTQSVPTKIEKRVGLLRQVVHPTKNTSNKEIAIMSYVYTDSFDAKEQIITSAE